MTKARRQWFENVAAGAVGAGLGVMPRSAALALGRAAGTLMARLARRHVGIAEANLAAAFPGWDAERRRRTAHGVYRHFASVILDILWLQQRRPDRLLDLVDVVGREHADEGARRGRGVVWVTGHIGNWEVHGLAHSLVHAPLTVIARPLDNAALDARLVAFRSRGGNQVLYKQRALARAMQALRQGGSVAVLVDQNVQEQDGIFVDFFGRPACTTTVAAALAVKCGATLQSGHTELTPDGRYRLIYDPPLEWEPSGDRLGDVARLTQRMTWRIESWIRSAPEQWLWIHRRWHTRPSGGFEPILPRPAWLPAVAGETAAAPGPTATGEPPRPAEAGPS